MKARVLAVDDSRTIRFQVRQILENDLESEFEVFQAEDGLQALQWLSGCIDSELPDIVILDRNMPKMTGDECIQTLKTDEVWKYIPVLFLTAQDEVSELVKGLSELQADDYLHKPFDAKEFLARVKVLVRMKQAEDEIRYLNQDLESALRLQRKAYRELKDTKIQLAETEKIAAMTNTFKKFVPVQFLERIANKGIENIEIGTVEKTKMAVLFSDVRSFTNLSESMSAQEVFNFLNSYLSHMMAPLERNKCFVDKFIGDAIMALFDQGSTQDQALNSIRAAIEMQEVQLPYNEGRKRAGYQPISIGIGIHSGEVMIGTLGNQKRMESTVIGDTVNTASRIESLKKFYDSCIMVSGTTFDQLGTDPPFCWRKLDFIKVKGKEKPIESYEIINGHQQKIQEAKLNILEQYNQGLVEYYQQNWIQAIECFRECIRKFPEEKVSRIFIERSEKYQKNPLPEDWDFSYEFSSKQG